MKKLIVLLIVAAIGWHFYGSYLQRLPQLNLFSDQTVERSSQPATARSHSKVYTDIRLPEHPTQQAAPGLNAPVATANYRCDGRTHCSHMTSCEEATWFLRNCPDTKMDGDHDGIPCEQQWCSK
jgi:Excalibur calcium-binding domain